MAEIVKVILDNGEILECEAKASWADRNSFESKLLKYIDNDVIEEYATFYLDLVSEDAIEEREISDFNDDEVLEGVNNLRIYRNLATESFMERFLYIIDKVNPQEVEEVLINLENKI